MISNPQTMDQFRFEAIIAVLLMPTVATDMVHCLHFPFSFVFRLDECAKNRAKCENNGGGFRLAATWTTVVL